MATKSGTPAFPLEVTEYVHDRAVGSSVYHGLTKREYFAALAMQGICADSEMTFGINEFPPEVIAQMAVDRADALIEALNREGQANG